MGLEKKRVKFGLKRAGLKAQAAAWAMIFSMIFCIGCRETHKLAPPPDELPEHEMRFGALTPNHEAAELKYVPMVSIGTVVHEEVSSILESEGIPPVKISVRAEGQWGGTNDTSGFNITKLTLSPPEPNMEEEIREQLKTGRSPQNLPLGPLSLLDAPANTPPVPIRQALKPGAYANDLSIHGTWVCDRQDGKHQAGGFARKIVCSLEEGSTLQQHNDETRTRQRKARLQGALSAVRAAKAGEDNISLEEIHLTLSAWSQTPRPTLIELSYTRKTCQYEDFCPIFDR